MKSRVFNLADNAYQFWKPFLYQETVIDFPHLRACKHQFSHPTRAENYTLYFTFSHHVFTRSYLKNETIDLPHQYPFPTSDLRVFDIQRYELSLNIPQIIATLPNQFCYHGGYSRYCSCKIHTKDGASLYYQIVYRTWKQKGKLRFHIESAYALPSRPSKAKKVNFWVICHNLLHGKKLPLPPKH
ncbi:MAG TPA: heat-shock protein [Oceanospirillaceae bacterium]|mgnify:CR=1 FL=1|nr:heat-shock protein [Oceanospirillaceae bacterium]